MVPAARIGGKRTVKAVRMPRASMPEISLISVTE
jgi:hypothetical protein